MLMIWAILLMSVTVLGVVEYIRASAAESVQAAYQFKALHLAESGLAVGLHPNTRRGDLVLKQKISENSGFDVVINYEGARIPINYATDERLREAIYNLLVHWQLNAEEASIAADSLADWIDNDDNARANGVQMQAGLPDRAQGVYPLVLANILATPLKLLAPVLCGHLAPGGHLVLAGILARQADELRAAYAPWCELQVSDSDDGWILMTAQRPA